MEKSRLGLPLKLFGALLFFIGASGMGVLILSLATVYIMLYETNEWLKKMVIRALIISITFSILILSLSQLSVWLPLFLGSSDVVDGTFRVTTSAMIASRLPMLHFIARMLEIVVFVVIGFYILCTQQKTD